MAESIKTRFHVFFILTSTVPRIFFLIALTGFSVAMRENVRNDRIPCFRYCPLKGFSMISLAYAQEAAAQAQPSGGLMSFLPMLLLFGVIWFMMIRPQMKRAKEHRQLVEGLQKGDEIITQGGLTGRVTKVGETYVSLEVASGTEVLMQRDAVVLVLPKGTLKSAL
jgi:preprotein translocase subunit YajC